MTIFGRLNKSWVKCVLLYSICILSLLISYQPSFYGMFRNDDWKFISNGNDLWGEFDLFHYLKRSLACEVSKGLEIHHLQILSNFSSFCKYYIFGNDLFLHHLSSFLVHSINTLLCLLLSYLLTRSYRIAICSMFLFSSSYLIFDTVSWAGQWAFLNITMVSLGSLIMLILYFRNSERRIYLTLCIICAVIGMFVFELGIVIPINLGVVSLYFLQKREIEKDQFRAVLAPSVLLLFLYFLVYFLWVDITQVPGIFSKNGIWDYRYYAAVGIGCVKMIWGGLGQQFDDMVLDSYYITDMRLSFLVVVPVVLGFLILAGRNKVKEEIVLILMLLGLSILPFALISISRYMTQYHLRTYNLELLSPLMPRYYYMGHTYFSMAVACLFILPSLSHDSMRLRFVSYSCIALILVSNLVQIHKGNTFIKKELKPMEEMVSAVIDLLHREERDKYILPYGRVRKMSWGFNDGLKHFFFKNPNILSRIEQSDTPEYEYCNGKFNRIKKEWYPNGKTS